MMHPHQWPPYTSVADTPDCTYMNHMNSRDTTAPSIRSLIEALPREEFLDAQILFEDAHYEGEIGPTRMVLPSRRAVEQMVRALEVQEEDRVLHIGTGFGFTALVLGLVASQVISLERVPHRAAFAQERIDAFGRDNVTVLQTEDLNAPGVRGPFDAILVETTNGVVTSKMLDLLTVGGRLVACSGITPTSQHLFRYRRVSDEETQREDLGEFGLVPSLEEILVDLGVTDKARASEIRKISKTGRVGLTRALMNMGDIDETEIYRALALQRGLRLASTEELITEIEADAVDRIPRPFMKHNQFVPIRCRDSRFLVASSDPNADVAVLRGASGCDEVECLLIPPTDYRRLWRAIELEQFGARIDTPAGKPGEEDLLDRFSDPREQHDEEFRSRIGSLFDGILIDAVAERASDIHFENYDDGVRVRFRIDGDCVDMGHYRISQRELLGIINVIKIGAKLDIAERRLPQGGRMERKVGGRHFDLRVQTQPTHQGEYVVIRLLPRDNRMLTIAELGFPDHLAREYERLLISPSGMVLVVGPTGSGKSTTLYSGLQLLADDPTKKVITVEDPVEYSIDRVQQTQVKPRIGFGFADAMRSFVRQDPDVILVGEIRDGETALEAIRASQTGHLVLSTLHANDSVDAVQRLFDLGMHPNSVASELIAVIAQRLARRLCPHCKEQVPCDASIAAEVFPGGVPEDFLCYKGRGCTRCNQRGTRGRIAVIEFLKASASVRRAISQQLQVDELRDRCLDAGLYTMRKTALDLVRQGMISFEELRRILPEERMAPESNE